MRDRGWETLPFSQVVCHPEALDELARAKKPAVWLCSALGDLFDDQVSEEFLWRVFWEMSKASQHTFLVLTKQAKRMRDWQRDTEISMRNSPHTGPGLPPNLWLGVTVCNQADADARIPLLLDTPAAHRWVSVEPMLEAIDLTRWFMDGHECGIHWVVAGCESGPGARPCETQWLWQLRDQCKTAGVPYYPKQYRDCDGKVHRLGPLPKALPWTLRPKGAKR